MTHESHEPRHESSTDHGHESHEPRHESSTDHGHESHEPRHESSTDHGHESHEPRHESSTVHGRGSGGAVTLETLARQTLAERAYRALLDAIVTGRLEPGRRLRDHELATELGVSRTPVREALRQLQDEGLVEAERNAYTRVAPVRPEKLAEAFPVVAALHALATRLGVPALDAADLQAMETHDAARTAALRRRDVPGAIAADDRFHAVLLNAARNNEIERLLARLMPHVRRLDLLHFEALTHQDDPGRDHAAILDACRRRAAHEAAELVERSFLGLGESIATLLGR
jgi:DNA-binding GntR family transcriptional regulator